MKKNMWLMLACGLFMSTLSHAQTGGANTASDQNKGLTASTVCNADGTVTFNYRNDRAKDVQVDVQFAGRKPMTRDPQTGLWTVTLGPAAPDMYPYCFVVDGVSIMDPQCDQFFPNEGFKNSLLEIPAREGSLAHDIKDVPHGTMVYIHYYSKSLGATNNALVYLPPSYMWNRDKRYPVFYLISGTTDTEEVYYKVGRMNFILDNLLAEGKAQEMIIVLPYGNPYKLLPSIPDMAGVPQTRFGGDVFSKDLNDDLMPYIEENYRTLADRDHRAIGGFSRGGNQALFNGLSHLDKFSYLCSYSSFTSTDIPGVYDNAADTNAKIHLFWLGVGTDDFLFGNARDYMEHLDKKGIRSVKEFTHDKFGHTWMNARYFLDKTFRLLFNPEASEAAMRQGLPAPAATGKEPQFTAGVMARMFPRPIISPDYHTDAITFRFKAPEAQQVMLQYELEKQPIAMQKDSDGVWTAEVSNPVAQVADWPVFTYYFIVDGMPVADPNNMYLAPQHGFKPSIARHPQSRYSFASMGDIPHGRVIYQPSNNLCFYNTPAQYYNSPRQTDSMRPFSVYLIPGENDTPESWFKIGGANAMADALLASNQIPPVSIFSGKDMEKVSNALILRASDFKTWSERSKALEQLLLQQK
ncbi:MAG: hypothetical protein J5506_04615 [Prevotella sp.]|nr:hypothetical protein [Prevotella sp.]